MKIAMIGHKRIPSREGGVEICVEELAVRMVQAGHEVVAYNRKRRGDETRKEYKGVKIVTVPTINKKSLDAFVYSFLATVRALFGHYDIIHYHALGPSVMCIIPKLFGKKVVCTVHGLDWQRAKWGGFGTKYLLLGERIAARHADEVIVLSRNVQNYFREKYGRETVYIPNGVSEPKHREPEIIQKKYGLGKNSYILFLARIVPEKGLHYLIKAYRQLDTDVKLVICGSSSHSDDYFEQIKRMASQDKRILMAGFVEGQELEEFYSNALIYVLPSEIEGMPLSLLEAMSYGNCCIVSNIPENTEVTGGSAVTFQSKDSESLMNALKNCLCHREIIGKYRLLSEAIAKADFSWEKCAGETLGVYQKTVHCKNFHSL